MKKNKWIKKFTIVIGSLFLSFSLTTHAIHAMIKSNAETNYPTRIWVEDKSDRAYYYKYSERIFRGTLYKGYIGIVKGAITEKGSGFIYSGYIYRYDLPYPMPTRILPKLERE